MKKTSCFLLLFNLSLIFVFTGCNSIGQNDTKTTAATVLSTHDNSEKENLNGNPTNQEPTETESKILYTNKEYGFTFSLPPKWKGYTIINDMWKGTAVGNQQGDKVVETGPMILIRHPEWTKVNPRQDIPIMIFTLAQWSSLEKEQFHIGAAPIGPKKLGQNNKYVFALPARYNYAFLKGYEEVEAILNNGALQPINVNGNNN